VRPLALIAALLLCACAGGGDAQPVPDETAAIAMAKERCAFLGPAIGSWHARLHDGQWHVWWVPDAMQHEPAIGQRDIWIRAADGHAGSCNHG
jgi:hypothetical protein